MQPRDKTNTTHISVSVTDTETDADTICSLIEGLHDRVEEAEERAATAEKRVEELTERVTEVEAENEELRELIATTRREQADIRGDLHDLQSGSAGTNPTPDTPDQPPEPQTVEPETSLEQVLQMPSEVAEAQLTQNQQRARKVAAGVEQYADSVPAGRALSASVLRRVLSAHSGGDRVHAETLKRVREFLTRLGGDEVEVKETRGGTTTVVFDKGLVRRIAAQKENHAVVSRGGMDGGVGV